MSKDSFDMDKLLELERLAKEATPGPWTTDFDTNRENSLFVMLDRVMEMDVLAVAEAKLEDPWDIPQTKVDFRYIAAANPQTLLKLIAVVRAAKTYVDRECSMDVDMSILELGKALEALED